MSAYLYILFWVISFGASIAGAICGIGGGVIIKPVLDAFGVLSVSTISFLSSCTVLCMTCYSVIKGKMSGESLIDMRTGTPLGIGAAIGGVAGKSMFQALSSMFADKDMVGAVQAACLLVITLGTLIYTIKKDQVKTLQVENAAACVVIGLVLGIFSSFLGIGGGPINLVVLFYFFSMETKTAAANALYVILISQTAALLQTIATANVPSVNLELIVLMVFGGLAGGAAGRRLNKRLETAAVDRLFAAVMGLILAVCVYNLFRFI